MSVVRQDAWTTEHDIILKNTVISHIASGSTQLKAFDEVAEKLNRTPSACGFRWNAQLRALHAEEVKDAKKQRYTLKHGNKAPNVVLEIVSTPAAENEEKSRLQQEIAELKNHINYLQGTYVKHLNERLLKLERELEGHQRRATKYQSLFHRSVQMSTMYSEIKALEAK